MNHVLYNFSLKGILTDVNYRVLSKLFKCEFFTYLWCTALRSTLPQRSWAEIIPVGAYEIRAIFTEKSRTRSRLYSTQSMGAMKYT